MPKNKGTSQKTASHYSFRKGRKKSQARKKRKRELKARADIQKRGPRYAISLKLSVYGQVTRMLGSGRLEVYCFDGQTRLAHIRGKLRKKVWINQGDIVLISLRDFQEDKCDVLLKYTPDEARVLKQIKEIPEGAKINENDMQGPGGDDECVFEFEEDDIDDI